MLPLALPPAPVAELPAVETAYAAPFEALDLSAPLTESLRTEPPLQAHRLSSIEGLSSAANPTRGQDRTVDRSQEFLRLYDGARGGGTAFSVDAAKEHRFLLVPGFMWDFAPRMFGPNIDELRAMDIDAKFVRVHSMGAVERNARIVIKAIEDSPKPVVIIAHSKGGLDVMKALTDRPDLVAKVTAFVAIQTPFDGVAFAAPLRYLPKLRVTIQAAIRLIRHQWRDLALLFDDALAEIVQSSSGSAEPPKVPRLVSIVSALGRDASQAFLPLRMARWITRWATGKDTDGFIDPDAATLRGSEVIKLPGLSHSAPVVDLGPLDRPIYDARALTRALVQYLFP